MKGIAGRHVIVTGGGAGIGRAICERLAGEGGIVHIFDVDERGADETRNLLQGNARGEVMPVDVGDHESVVAAVDGLGEQVGRIDLLVNNAGWDRSVRFLDTEPEFWHKVIGVNYLGPLHMMHAVLPVMMAGGGGKVVNIASDAGRVGSVGEAVYSGCKGGVIALGKAIAREVGREGICINTVCPGPTETPLLDAFTGTGEAAEEARRRLARAVPLGRIGQPVDIAGIVAFLLSDDADFITGQVISVSGGITMHG